MAVIRELTTVFVEVKSIVITKGFRPIDPGALEKLRGSIEKDGLLHPIGIRSNPAPTEGKEWLLEYGRQRLEAARSLGLTVIEAKVTSHTDKEAQSARIAENLFRSQQSPARMRLDFTRWKEIQEELDSGEEGAVSAGPSLEDYAGSDFEASMTDDEWIAWCCPGILKKLGPECLAGFKADAILYRNTVGFRHSYAKAARTALKQAEPNISGPFARAVKRLANVNSPNDWSVCLQCSGGGKIPIGTALHAKQCDRCYGAGYSLSTFVPYKRR